MKPIDWRRVYLVVVVYICALCLLCHGLRVEDTKAPETEVPTVIEQEQDFRGDRKQKTDRQRVSNSNSNNPPQPSINNNRQVTTAETQFLDGSGGIYNPDDLQMGCTELRSKRYISDGFCTSLKPITEVVCAGECLPIDNGQLPFYAQYMKVWSREKTREYRCVNDVVRQKRIHLICDNGETRTYRIRTVRSCKCKKYNKEHNKSQLYDNRQSTPRKTKSTESERRSRKRKRSKRNRQRRSEDPRTERVR